jgi:hypothetical protein
MDFATYWTIVPIIGMGLTVPFWAWLWFTRPSRRKDTRADVARR